MKMRINKALGAALVFWSLLVSAGCTHDINQPDPETAANDVNAVLDDLHAQAAAANFLGYFELYAPTAVFLGTDRSEYWPLEEFKAYTKPRFETGKGWTYTPISRQLHFHGNTAWFEEELRSESYGRVRGTGVLVKLPDAASGSDLWRVAQYNLTLPIPNPLFSDVAKNIKEFYGEP